MLHRESDSASKMTEIVSGEALNSTHSLVQKTMLLVCVLARALFSIIVT